jgi:hypothetical protein
MYPKRRQLNGVLTGFLGTFTSRHADFEGYWLFGFIVKKIVLLDIDLLAKKTSAVGAIAEAENIARIRFRAQLSKHGFDECAAVEARLRIEPCREEIERLVGNILRRGSDLAFHASILSDMGSLYSRSHTVFVASHDPRFELRSVRRFA